MTHDEYMKLFHVIQDLHNVATDHAYDKCESNDGEGILYVEAEEFEKLFGNFLIKNPELVSVVKKHYKDEFEDYLPITWSAFFKNVKHCMTA